MNKLKEKALEQIIECACELFLEKSIAEVTVKDVADRAEVGEASIYRYFTKKSNVVARCAMMLQTRVFNEYFLLNGKNGFDKLSQFYGSYLTVFKHHPEFLRFINEFDAFILERGADNLGEYGEKLDMFHGSFIKVYEEGLIDGSVRELKDVDSFYYASTHALLELCKKLSANVRIVKQDEMVEKEEEIKALTDVMLFYLKKGLAE